MPLIKIYRGLTIWYVNWSENSSISYGIVCIIKKKRLSLVSFLTSKMITQEVYNSKVSRLKFVPLDAKYVIILEWNVEP